MKKNKDNECVGVFISPAVARLIDKLKPKYAEGLRKCIADICMGRPVDLDNIEGDLLEVIASELLEAVQMSRERMEQIRKQRAEAGKKGADATNEKKRNKRQKSANNGKSQQNTANTDKNGNKDKYKDKDKDKDKNEIIKQDEINEIKIEFGKSVFLFQHEYDDLVGLYGAVAVQWMIEKLSNYKLANGKKYDSDYNAILSWVVEAYKKEGMSRHEYEKQKDKERRDAEFAHYMYEKLNEIETKVVDNSI